MENQKKKMKPLLVRIGHGLSEAKQVLPACLVCGQVWRVLRGWKDPRARVRQGRSGPLCLRDGGTLSVSGKEPGPSSLLPLPRALRDTGPVPPAVGAQPLLSSSVQPLRPFSKRQENGGLMCRTLAPSWKRSGKDLDAPS